MTRTDKFCVDCGGVHGDTCPPHEVRPTGVAGLQESYRAACDALDAKDEWHADYVAEANRKLEEKDVEIERLRKQWTGVPDEYADWEEFGNSLLEDNDQLTDQCLERGKEITRLRAELAEYRYGTTSKKYKVAKERDLDCFDEKEQGK